MQNRPVIHWGAGCALIVVAAGCGSGGASDALADAHARCEALEGAVGHATMDSAGIHVIANVTQAADGNGAPRLSAEPTVSIGVTHGEAAYEFGGISSATRMPDGRIIVGDVQTGELKVFDRAGRYVRTLGGQGAGPGEYRAVSAVFRGQGDTLWIEDIGNRRITKLGRSFDVVETFQMSTVPWTRPPRVPGAEPTRGRSVVRIQGVFDDGTALATHRFYDGPRVEVTNAHRDSLMVRRIRFDGAVVDSLGIVAGWQNYEYFPGDGSLWFGVAPFSHGVSLAAAGDRYYTGGGYRFEIEERAPDGKLMRVIRLCEDPDPITEDQLEARIEAIVADYPPDARAGEERALRGIPQPAVAPSYVGLMVDETGRLWARDFTIPGEPLRWKVFDGEGRWLGAVTTPADLTVLEIGADYLLGRHTNELDVQSVRLYALETDA